MATRRTTRGATDAEAMAGTFASKTGLTREDFTPGERGLAVWRAAVVLWCFVGLYRVPRFGECTFVRFFVCQVDSLPQLPSLPRAFKTSWQGAEPHRRGSGGAAGCRFSILYGCHACPRNGGLPSLLRRGGV